MRSETIQTRERKNLANRFKFTQRIMYLERFKFNFRLYFKITTSKSRIETFLVIYRVFDPPMNRYYSIINSGDLKFVKSNKIKEVLSRLHNTSFSYVETTVEYEKQLKQSFLPFICSKSSQYYFARDDQNVSMKEYVDKAS